MIFPDFEFKSNGKLLNLKSANPLSLSCCAEQLKKCRK